MQAGMKLYHVESYVLSIEKTRLHLIAIYDLILGDRVVDDIRGVHTRPQRNNPEAHKYAHMLGMVRKPLI